ncbi:MAG: tyrosine-type recombinase/integrase [Methylobacterium sp.]|nr:tyrosine-type recombinase/integrase [Methylobacterium sp.]MCA3644643.1 tyrosine-type recombinase/integrase [Methylobacterium sp.]
MAVEKLSALTVKGAKAGIHGDGGGLYLKMTPGRNAGSEDGTGAPSEPRRSWAYIYQRHGKRCELSLGTFPDVSLKAARDHARQLREMRARGLDPKDEREAAEAAAIAARAAAAAAKAEAEAEVARIAAAAENTFGKWADRYVADAKSGFRNPKHAAQVETTLGCKPYDERKIRGDRKAHAEHVKALAALRALPIGAVDRAAVAAVLRPLWLDKQETADRIRQRIENVFKKAIDSEIGLSFNPATIGKKGKGGIGFFLPARPTLSETEEKHHAALPYPHVPAFMDEIGKREDTSCRLLTFIVLTACRTGEARCAEWREFDLDKAIWTIPGKRMKAGREHRAPLAPQVVELLKALAKARVSNAPEAMVFPGRRGKPMSVMAPAMVLRRLAKAWKGEGSAPWADATVHGFLSAFRDWVGEETNFPREIAEAALAHVIGDATERAYRRRDALERRRELMIAWANFAMSAQNAQNVLPFAAEQARKRSSQIG